VKLTATNRRWLIFFGALVLVIIIVGTIYHWG